MTCHQLRHTQGRDPVEAGVNIRVIQERLGHARVTQTQLHAEVSESTRAEAVEKLPPLNDQPDKVGPVVAKVLDALQGTLTPEQKKALAKALDGEEGDAGE